MERRDYRWDFYKGILIFGVILGHTITAFKCGSTVSSWLAVFLRTYDMPMFAFVTGYFLYKSCKRRKAHLNILNKITSILFPIVLWNLIFNLASLNLSFSIGRFWFLWSIFYVSVIIIAVDSLFSFNKIIKFLVLCLIIIAFHTVIKDSHNIGFLFIPCIFGFYFYELKQLLHSKKINMFYLKVCFFLAFILLYCFWKVDYNVWNTGCNVFAFNTPVKTTLVILYRTVLGLVGCIVMKISFDLIFHLWTRSRHKLLNKLSDLIIEAGQCTLELYILQTFFVENIGARVLKKIIELLNFNPFVIHINLLNLIIAPLTTVIAVIVMCYLQKYLKKIPCVGGFIFGFSNLSFRLVKKESIH